MNGGNPKLFYYKLLFFLKIGESATHHLVEPETQSCQEVHQLAPEENEDSAGNSRPLDQNEEQEDEGGHQGEQEGGRGHQGEEASQHGESA